MIPIRLSIQGLYSYQELQEIDFQPLTGSSVFGIFGKVGSGKTSLLEAISFALYGKTERLNDQDKRAYNMMNLKSKHLKIDFEFQAGPEQYLYKFVYEAKRHPKKHHEIGPGERRMFIRRDNDWHPIGNEKEDVSVLSKQILGLDYDNFKRTIIIPQNQFREFLELSPRDRTDMMNQLFKLDQYDLAGRVKKLSDANDNQLAELRGLLAPLETVTLEAIEHAKDDIATLLINVDEKDAQIALLELDEQRLIHLQKQHVVFTTTRQALAEWLLDEPEYLKIQQAIEQYERCRLLFQSDLLQFERLKLKKNGLLDMENKALCVLKTVTDKLPHLQTVYKEAKTAYENRDQLQKQLAQLDTVQLIRTSQESLTRKEQEREVVGQNVISQHKLIDQYRNERSGHYTTIENLPEQASTMERLYQVQNWFDTHKPLKKQADNLQAQIEDYEQNLDHTKQRKNQVLNGFSAEWVGLTLKTLPATIEQSISEWEQVVGQNRLSHQQTLLKYELQQYAESLTNGKPCPLCGSEHHPHKHGFGLTDVDVSKSETALNESVYRVKSLTGLRLTIEGLYKELLGIVDAGKKLINERGEVTKRLIEHEDKFVWSEFTKQQGDTVVRAIEQERIYQKQLDDARKAIDELSRDIEKADQQLAALTIQHTRISTVIDELNSGLRKDIASLTHYEPSVVAQLNLIQIADLRESLTQQYDHAKTAFDEAEKERNDVEKEQVAADGQVKELTKQRITVDEEVEILNHTIEKTLLYNDLKREQVEQILQTDLDVTGEKQRIEEYTDKLRGLQRVVSELETELTHQPFDPAALFTVQEQLRTVRSEKDDLNKAIGKAGNVLATLQRQWDKKQEHQKRHDELDLRRQDLKKMDEMFRAQGFVNYVSSVYLKNLCESANERFFKLTNNQLKLELDEKNNFLIRDFLNGGEVRSVKTLSGGQTFQAALSLALALSDNIQHLTKAKQNLFFLDEGFGTLDKDSLQTVFKTLKALRSENRVVGIISHVEELQQEVDNFIRAEATENGSRIVRSWDI